MVSRTMSTRDEVRFFSGKEKSSHHYNVTSAT